MVIGTDRDFYEYVEKMQTDTKQKFLRNNLIQNMFYQSYFFYKKHSLGKIKLNILGIGFLQNSFTLPQSCDQCPNLCQLISTLEIRILPYLNHLPGYIFYAPSKCCHGIKKELYKYKGIFHKCLNNFDKLQLDNSKQESCKLFDTKVY